MLAAGRGAIRCPTCKATIPFDERHPALARSDHRGGAERPAPTPTPAAALAPASPCVRNAASGNVACHEDADVAQDPQHLSLVDLTAASPDRASPERTTPPPKDEPAPPTPPSAQRRLPPSLNDPAALRAVILAHAEAAGESPAHATPAHTSPPSCTRTPPPPAPSDQPDATTPVSAAPPPTSDAADATDEPITSAAEEEEEPPEDTWATYRPAHVREGRPHPDPVVESAALAAVTPPPATHAPRIRHAIDQGLISALQVESVVYAMQRHEQSVWLNDAEGRACRFKAGFFIGDGAGVGKARIPSLPHCHYRSRHSTGLHAARGARLQREPNQRNIGDNKTTDALPLQGRTLAAMILEAWSCGRRRHVWVSVSSDLCADAKRDLEDVGAAFIPVHVLQSVPYARTATIRQDYPQGVMFLSYSTLITGTDAHLDFCIGLRTGRTAVCTCEQAAWASMRGRKVAVDVRAQAGSRRA